MTFVDIPAGDRVFLDANTLIYHFTNDPKYGPACTQLLKRVVNQDVLGITSSHAIADVAHRLMTLEAIVRNSWPPSGIAARLRKHHDEIPKLAVYLQAISEISQSGIQVLSVTQSQVQAASALSHRYELLTGDALVAAIMQNHGLTTLASNDADFDRVPGITRYAPI